MSRKVALYREVRRKNSHGKFERKCEKVNLGRGRRPNDLFGPFYLRYTDFDTGKRRWAHVGDDFAAAVDAREDREKILRAKAAGITVPEQEDAEPYRISVDKAIAEYLSYGKATRKGWRRKTVIAYKRTLALFRESCNRTYVDVICRNDVLKFLAYLRRKRSPSGKRLSDRSVSNHFINVISFLNEYGKTGLVKPDEWPKYEGPKVRVYTDEDLTVLLRAANREERDAIEMLVGSRCREGEFAHNEWADIFHDTGEIHIRSKREKYGWEVKDSEQRLVPLSEPIMEMLRRRRERHPKDVLLFPTEKGKPNLHLLRTLKLVALRAGLNCGICVANRGGRSVSCTTHPVCRRILLHRFRKTWATRRSREGMDIVTLAEKLGHSDLDTTRRYLQSDDNNSKRLRKQINAADAILLQGFEP